jgi:chorismate-pyruvate lyase
MSAEVQDQFRPLEWLEHPLDREFPPRPALREWLTYEGLLTVRLKQACPDGFRLELLQAGAGPGLLVAEEHIRRVILWCGEYPCIYAESHLPQEALALLPSLRRLGGDALGEALHAHPDVTRGDFEYALLRAPKLPSVLLDHVEGRLWARRSKFKVGDSNLAVAEVFLPRIEALRP